MFHPLELFIGLRYMRAKRRNQLISFTSFSSMIGIALGITALITVLSVMNGFEKELRERILGMASHATISGVRGKLHGWQPLAERAAETEHVVGVAPYIQAEGMLSFGREVNGAIIRGVDPDIESQVSEVSEKVSQGEFTSLQAEGFNIVLGKELAWSLGVGIGDKLTLVTPQASVTVAGVMPRLKRFTVSGIFEVGMYEYDHGMAFIHIRDAAKLFRFGEAISGVRLKLDDMFLAPATSRDLAETMPVSVRVSDWTRQHANFFRAVKTEKTAMFIMLMLIIAVAAFNIVSTLVMVVADKRADIAILRTIGASPRSIMAIFMVQGTLIGVIGTVLGVLGGVALALNVPDLVAWIERLLEIEFLSAQVYYISSMPSDLRIDDVTRVAVVAFLLSVVATIYPAWRAARTQPAEALRYE
ncbi:ABC transporter permease [Solemya pervernicosa gill symbiont]|uniref:ABC transporter permease n=2 Tax=Gammaproteobacteria incertae sedis TaxID=118884 RepID=A0A1T2LAC3_9GAMM|nr:lipoprotein-releasing ABC transporter permease subunit [Candidatus Reidiella endopervernicosa]OOZ42057.1 ABC transporter permease [Solemya pervernicosa gill symbiont]QKQ26990.1 lipoprotein-releasing ABC transporter permease subunit [Candidatus Reidiella endopervernicosa]